jgi:hypothetical protein
MSDYLERDTPGEIFKGANKFSDASLLKVLMFVLNRSVGTDNQNISRTCKMTLERIYAEFARRVQILWPLPRDEWNVDELNQYNSYFSVYDQTFHFRIGGGGGIVQKKLWSPQTKNFVYETWRTF